MVYAIDKDMTEVYGNPDLWSNHGRRVLQDNCKHHKDSKESNNISYSGYCEKCGVSEDTGIPMMNYLYPLELKDFDDDKILKVMKETNCSVLENTEDGNFYIVLCGGGMDLSQDIALSYIILETWLPNDLLNNVCKQAEFSISKKNYKLLARQMIRQLKIRAGQFRNESKQWKENLKNLKLKDKKKSN